MKSKGKILVVDDDETNRLVVRVLMERRGFSVSEADSGAVALDSVKSDHFDIVLMDLSMPGMDGFETTRKMRESAACLETLPIVALTAHSSKQDIARCFKIGMNGVLPKPFDSQRADQLLSLMTSRGGERPC